MKPLLSLMIAVSILFAGCAWLPEEAGSSGETVGLAPTIHPVVSQPARSTSSGSVRIQDRDGEAVVQKVPFRAGVSSSTVERMAKRFGCTGGVGAGLLTETGPMEIYRMECENGTTFMAQCELRQCRPMR